MKAVLGVVLPRDILSKSHYAEAEQIVKCVVKISVMALTSHLLVSTRVSCGKKLEQRVNCLARVRAWRSNRAMYAGHAVPPPGRYEAIIRQTFIGTK